MRCAMGVVASGHVVLRCNDHREFVPDIDEEELSTE